jgi:hypothetical protein
VRKPQEAKRARARKTHIDKHLLDRGRILVVKQRGRTLTRHFNTRARRARSARDRGERKLLLEPEAACTSHAGIVLASRL